MKHEDSIQKAVMAWARWQPLAPIGIAGKLSDFIQHSPNGGARNPREGKNFKLMGTQAGFPDLFIYIPRGGYHGLFIELKRPKTATSAKGQLQATQKAVIERLNSQGYKAVVCFGANEAIDEIKAYLGVA
ncbi:VRR-NUC domain-containing protein [Moraxella sp. K2450]|uniref:VRR-NUC domain-containing protein n=1 Tax=Moraxella sp. K2450 TaxID=2780076 RepID=UPI001880F27E|nr:VRR-NUC domain-containing protein [Moraxella sp. K2450]MBE9597159.1 VRR-NUC domain-containing protein [Moraxella sp. K2450]